LSFEAAPSPPGQAASGTRVGLIALVLSGVVFLGSIEPIRNYDYFWHLATGRWMVDSGRLPEQDPFGLASEPQPWINYFWLFQLALYAAHSIAGHAGMSMLRALVVASLLALVFLLSSRRTGWPAALLLTAIAWYGADHRLTVRPETMGTFFVVAEIWLVLPPIRWAKVLASLLLTVVWVNVHPSALLSPCIAVLGLLFAVEHREELRQRAALVAGSSIALLLSPYGLTGVLAPLRLMRMIGERQFVNLEWLPSRPGDFPLLYIVLASGIVLVLKSGKRRAELGSIALFGFFAFLAVRYLRNQGFFFASAPILLAPFFPREVSSHLKILAAGGAALIAAIMLAGRLPIRSGVDQTVFPVRAVDKLRESGIPGNIYNPDQFGGYLIWTFYPQRRVLTDGRNELYASFLREYDAALRNNRDWVRLLAKYRITIAVEEYRRSTLEVIDAATGARRSIPASLAYFPRDRWALISFDDAAMVLVRRDAVPPGRLRSLEYRVLIPDAGAVAGSSAAVRAELARAMAEAGPDSLVVRRLVEAYQRTRQKEFGS
jgi:hypothetical protein